MTERNVGLLQLLAYQSQGLHFLAGDFIALDLFVPPAMSAHAPQLLVERPIGHTNMRWCLVKLLSVVVQSKSYCLPASLQRRTEFKHHLVASRVHMDMDRLARA